MHFCQISHNIRWSEYLCKLGKEYINAGTCKFYALHRQNSATFDVTIPKLQLPKAVCFGPPCTYLLIYLDILGKLTEMTTFMQFKLKKSVSVNFFIKCDFSNLILAGDSCEKVGETT